MYKKFCDICGKEINSTRTWSKYKLKKEWYAFGESWWEKLDVHDECYHEMCKYIKEKKENQKE